MLSQLTIGDLTIEVDFKPIKNIHLSVHPPDGHVRIASPPRVALETLRVFAVTKLPWIRKQQKKFRSQKRETPREYLDRESHYLWGERLLLKVIQKEEAPKLELKHRRLVLTIRPDMRKESREELIAQWYRRSLKEEVARLIAKWEPILRVKVHQFFIRRMKTKWGSCNPLKGTIRLNTELAKKPKEYLEYVVVHEIVHLLESRHNKKFKHLMDRYLPNWKDLRDQLKNTSIEQEDWSPSRTQGRKIEFLNRD
jgi:hypothetical protein